MVDRHTTVPYDFTCYTDNPTGINVPHLPLLEPVMTGWWNKLNFFKLKEHILFLDLDIIIINNIDSLFMLNEDFAVLRCPSYRRHKFNTTIIFFVPSKCRIQINDIHRHYSDQEYIQAHLKAKKVFIEDLRIVSYKYNILQLRQDPTKAKIVYCHGEPKPHELTHLPWVQEHWR